MATPRALATIAAVLQPVLPVLPSAPSTLHIAVLLHEPHPHLHVLTACLQASGFTVSPVASVAGLMHCVTVHSPQIVVLARCPPEEDEAALAGALRAQYPALGVVLLAATADVGAQVRALVLGADACLCEPIEPSMLVATLHSLVRRLQPSSRAEELPAAVSEAGGWRLLGGGWRLCAPDGQTVALTKSERPLLSRLLQQPGELVLREQLIAVLTSNVFEFDTHRLDSLIHRLRRKVAHQCAHPLPLNAVHGEGYVFVV